jgi:hypothetical protein
MCYSFQSSIIAWIISIIIVIILLIRNNKYDRWNAIFILSFSLMQLIEAGIWLNYDNPNNRIFTNLVLLDLFLQPLCQCYAGYLYTNDKLLYGLSILFGILFFGQIIRIILTPNNRYSQQGKNKHLMWLDIDNEFMGNPIIIALYFLGIFYPLLKMKNYLGWPLILIGLITAGYSFHKTRGREFGSHWCFTAVSYSIVSLIVGISF